MRNKISILRIIGVIASVCLAMSACTLPRVRYGGIVRGVVYADQNGNGVIDASEGPLTGATVQLNGCGPDLSTTTGADGMFSFTNLPEGSCLVSVTKGGWIFSGSYPSLGYPVPVASNPDLPTSFSLFMAPVMGITPAATAVPGSTDTIPPVPSPTPAGPILVPSDTPIVPTATSSNPMLLPRGDAVNCRFGPGTDFLTVGALKVGNSEPILGTIPDRSWWQIQNPQDIAGHFCWVADGVILTSGDLTRVPVVPVPVGLVTAVAVDPIATINGICHMPNVYDPHGSITTNGPTTVVYHWEIWRGGAIFRATSDTTLAFAGASTQAIDPGSDHGDCGDYIAKLIVTSPNNLSAQQSFSIVAATVTGVTVDPIATIHGLCHMPNVYNPRGSITTNGPATVVYRWEIWRDGVIFRSPGDTTLVFGSASTQALDPGVDHGDCGNYIAKLIVTSPNSVSTQQSFAIVEP